MHASVMSWIKEQVDTYDLASYKALEIGSQDINGSVRPYFTGSYIGIDMQPGPNVDVVSTADKLPFENSAFNIIICTEMLEHDPTPWLSLAEMGRVLKPGGRLLITTRGNGFPEHGYPSDYWRFMPASRELLLNLASCDLVTTSLDPEVSGVFIHGVRRE